MSDQQTGPNNAFGRAARGNPSLVAPDLPEPTPAQLRRADEAAPQRTSRNLAESAPPMPGIGTPIKPSPAVTSGYSAELTQPPAASIGSGMRAPRRKNQPSESSVYISGPAEVIGRFKAFHTDGEYAAYHDSLTALMILADKAIRDGYSLD